MEAGTRRNEYSRLTIYVSPNAYTGIGTHYVADFSTDLDHQARGFGKALFEQVMAEADEHGAILWLVVAPVELKMEERLTEFYRRSGFEGGSWGGVMHRYPKRD